MIHGTPNSIAVRLRNALAAEGVAMGDDALDRVVEALHVPLDRDATPLTPAMQAQLAREGRVGDADGFIEDRER